jgi:peptide methionine sulfoxide reductase MsrB
MITQQFEHGIEDSLNNALRRYVADAATGTVNEQLLAEIQQYATLIGETKKSPEFPKSILWQLQEVEQKFLDKFNQKRKASVRECERCGRWLVTRSSQPAKYCSLHCACKAKQEKNSRQVSCAKCGKEFLKPVSKMTAKSGLYFCSRACKDAAQRLGGIKEIMPDHYGKSDDYRGLFTEEELFCHRCGYNEFSSSVEIHHIDENHDNNARENLIPLCGCCHRALHRGHWTFSPEPLLRD